MCRSGSGKKYLPMGADLSPLISRLRRQLPPEGKPSVGSASYIESASNFNPSINILQKTKFTLKEVSQNEKVTHHSLPLRGGRCRRRRRMRADRKGKPQHKMIFAISAMFTTFAMFAQRKEGFPSGGSWRRRRLMRGINHRSRNAYKASRFPPTKRARQPHAATNSYLPKHKNFPHDPATLQKRNKSSLRKRRGHGGSSGRMREVWREKEPHPKGGSFSLQGLSPIPFPLTLPEYQTHNVPTGDDIPRASEDRRSSNRCQPACNQRLHR